MVAASAAVTRSSVREGMSRLPDLPDLPDLPGSTLTPTRRNGLCDQTTNGSAVRRSAT